MLDYKSLCNSFILRIKKKRTTLHFIQQEPSDRIIVHIGMDDTDSPTGLCTTYLGTIATYFILKEHDFKLIDYPQLIRLNPNVPFKTRGNGSVCLRVEIPSERINFLIEHIREIFEKNCDFSYPTTNPGLVFWIGKITAELQEFSIKALWKLCFLDEIQPFIDRPNVKCFGYKNKQGLIGSFAAIGSLLLTEDYTFELLTYRSPTSLSNIRNKNEARVWEVLSQKENWKETFGHADMNHKTLKIFPHGPDPVFCGIRGENPTAVLEFWHLIQPQPIPLFGMIFRTNQGTNHHFHEAAKIQQVLSCIDLTPYDVICKKAVVETHPRWLKGGHLTFDVNISGKIITCYAYEPSKEFRKSLKLLPGDMIEVRGNIRPSTPDYPVCINLEQVKICSLVSSIIKLNPFCITCHKRVESLGVNKGYRCKKCRVKYQIPPLEFETHMSQRELSVNQLLLPPEIAQRHQTKPFMRIGKEKTSFKFEFNDFLTYIQEFLSINRNM